MSFLSGMSSPAYRSWEEKPVRPQASSLPDVLGDLQSFIAWSEDIKLEMSLDNPSLHKVLGSLAFSKQPIEEGSVQASFLGRKSHLATIDEDKTLEATELQERNLGRQLGCLLVQRTQGETQKIATRWFSATNGWEAWRQLNLSFLSRLLKSLLQTSIDDDQPSSFLQQDPAWKERVVGHQELSEEESQLKRDQACKQNKGELNRVNFPQNSQQQNKQQQHKKTCKKKAEDNRVDFKITTSIQQRQEQSKQELARRGKGKGTPQEKGEAYKPLPQQQRGKGEQLLPNKAQRACREKPQEGKGKDEKSNPRAGACTDKLRQKEGKGHQTTPSFQKELTNKTLWCHICRKKGHDAQACWWKSNQQAQKHLQTAWKRRQNKKKELEQHKGNQSFAAWLASHKKLMNSLEKETCMRREDPMSVLASSEEASSKTAETWGKCVDKRAYKSFASPYKLSQAQSTSQLALGKAMVCDEGMAVQGGELCTHSFPTLQEQKPPSKKKTEKLEEQNRVDFTLNSFQQRHSNDNKKLQDKNHRASKSKPVESLEATLDACHASLSVACVYELSDSAWHDPRSVVKGQQEGQLSASRKPGQHLTNNCEACTQDKMLTNLQVTTRANPVGALLSMLGLGRLASFWGKAGSLEKSLMGGKVVPSKLVEKNHGAASPQLSDPKLHRENVKELAQLDSEELSQNELAKSTFESLQQKELASLWLKALKPGSTRASSFTIVTFLLVIVGSW